VILAIDIHDGEFYSPRE